MKDLVEAIQLEAKIKKCNTSMKRLFGDEYVEKVSFYRTALNGIMNTEKIDCLQAVLFACELESVKDNEMAIIMFMSAAVDIIENK